MDELKAFQSKTVDQHRHVVKEDALLDSLRVLWQPHRQRDLEVRYQMGVLLNHQLGDPARRQSYGQGTIERVAKELDLDKSEISRMRRFAQRFPSFEAVQSHVPSLTSWTKVRELVASSRTSHRPPDSRVLWGLQRSVKASIAALRCDVYFCGPQADHLRSALQELYHLAHFRLGVQFDAVRDDSRSVEELAGV